MAEISRLTIDSTTYDINVVHSCYNGTGTAAVTTSPYNFAKWECPLPEVTSLYDGLTIAYKVPVAGNGSYGTCLQVNSLGYHPVVRNKNSGISTRYGVDYTIIAVYNSGISGTVYNNSGSSSSITGCWVVVNDVDNNSDTLVSQSSTTTTNWRKVILSYQSDASTGAAVSSNTNVVYGAVGIEAQPNTGTLKAEKYNVANHATIQYNSTTQALDFIFI